MGVQAIPIELIDAFGIGLYLLLGLLHFDLWRHRPEQKAPLWLACASAGALMVDLTGMITRGTDIPFQSALALFNMLGVAIATSSLVNFVVSLASDSTPRLVRALQFVLLGMPFVAVPANAPRLVPSFMCLSGILLVWVSFVAIRASRRGDREARTIAAGLLVLIACLVADVLMELRVIGIVPGLPVLGFTVLFLTSAWALNARSHREYRELVQLRHELEARVADRTEELALLAAQFAAASRTDELTGLPNRRSFLEEAKRELERARRFGRPQSIVMGDIDHFKRVNDTFGHAAGDTVLKSVATALRASIRVEDLVVRWGGDEFVLLLPETDLAGARSVAEKVRRAIEAADVTFDGSRLRVTMSFGAAACKPGLSLDSMIADADRALYRAKEDGRNRVFVLDLEA